TCKHEINMLLFSCKLNFMKTRRNAYEETVRTWLAHHGPFPIAYSCLRSLWLSKFQQYRRSGYLKPGLFPELDPRCGPGRRGTGYVSEGTWIKRQAANEDV